MRVTLVIGNVRLTSGDMSTENAVLFAKEITDNISGRYLVTMSNDGISGYGKPVTENKEEPDSRTDDFFPAGSQKQVALTMAQSVAESVVEIFEDVECGVLINTYMRRFAHGASTITVTHEQITEALNDMISVVNSGHKALPEEFATLYKLLFDLHLILESEEL